MTSGSGKVTSLKEGTEGGKPAIMLIHVLYRKILQRWMVRLILLSTGV